MQHFSITLQSDNVFCFINKAMGQNCNSYTDRYFEFPYFGAYKLLYQVGEVCGQGGKGCNINLRVFCLFVFKSRRSRKIKTQDFAAKMFSGWKMQFHKMEVFYGHAVLPSQEKITASSRGEVKGGAEQRRKGSQRLFFPMGIINSIFH